MAAPLPEPLQELLRHEGADQVRQGLELALSLGLEGTLAEGCGLSRGGDIRVGPAVRRAVRRVFQLDVAMRLLAARGQLDGARCLRVRDPGARALSPAALSPLHGLHQLEALEVLNRQDLTDISPVATMRSLRRLDLSGARALSELGPLAGLPHLEEVRLLWCDALADLRPLAALPALTTLSLTLPVGEPLPPLPPLPSLQSLSLTTAREGALALAGLPSLRALSVSHCRGLESLSLAALPALRSVTLYGCWSLSSLALGPAVTDLRAVDCPALDQRT